MWRRRVALLFALAALALSPRLAAAQIRASADTYVDSKDDDVNFGSSTTSFVGRALLGMSPQVDRGLLAFDISALPPLGDRGVVLRLFIESTTSDPLDLPLIVQRLDMSFDEMTVTWNTQPGVIPDPSAEALMSTLEGDWFEIDVTALVAAARAGGDPDNLYLRIAAVDETTNDTQNFSYRTREFAGDFAPRLQFVAAIDAPAFSTWASMVAVAALLALGAFALARSNGTQR